MFTLTGTIKDHGDVPIAGSPLLILPSPSVTVDADGDTLHLGGITITTDEDGTFAASLVTAPGLTYTIRSSAGGPLTPCRFAAPDDGTTLDLTDITPVPAPAPAPFYAGPLYPREG